MDAGHATGEVTALPECSVGRLSDDLLWIIFELVHPAYPKTIQYLAQVSRQFRYVALEIQYREVVLMHKHLRLFVSSTAHAATEEPPREPSSQDDTTSNTAENAPEGFLSGCEEAGRDRVYEHVLERIHKSARQITFNATLDWDLAAEFLIHCQSLQSIVWASSFKLPGSLPQAILDFIAAKLPEVHISGRSWQPNWHINDHTLLSTMPPGCLKSLEYSCGHQDNLLCFGDFSGLKSLHVDRCDLHQPPSPPLPTNPFPALKILKLSLWKVPAVNIAKEELSLLLEMMCPLEHLDITCPGRYHGFSMPAKHKGLRILKLRNNSARNFFMDDASQHRMFWKRGIKDISSICPQISNLTLDMITKPERMNQCIRRLSSFSNVRFLTLRVQTQLIPSDPTRIPDYNADLHYVNGLVDEIVANTNSERLQSISIEAGDFKRRRQDDQRAHWERMLAEGYSRKRRFEFSRVEPGLFAIQNS